MTPYSLIEHLAKAIWFSRWREGWFGMFSAYFDASGDQTNVRAEFISIAGFIAETNVWIDFETKWNNCLTKYRIFGNDGSPEFHMVECANYTDSFDGWKTKQDERQALLKELMNIIKACVFRKFSCTIIVSELKKYLDEDLRNRFNFNYAYVLGGRACAARVAEWCRVEGYPTLDRVQLFFERGDGKVQELLRGRLVDDELLYPIYKPKKNRYSKNNELIEPRLVPFQAADVLAYVTNLEARMAARGTWGEKENIRWILKELDMPEPSWPFTPSLLRGFNILLRACTYEIPGPSNTS